jgi:hypothetical protein
MAKSRCKRGSRKCITGCVGKQPYRKIKKCAKGSKKCVDQACHKKTAKRGRRVATPVKSSYSLRSRGPNK